MRLVAWNIRAGGGARVGRIARHLADWQPSVVVLSEFRRTPPSQELAARLAQLGLVHQHATCPANEPGRNALLVASRWRLVPLRTRSAPREPARWLAVRVESPEPLRLGALHVPNKVTGRKYAFHDAVVAVARHWRRDPAMLIGDTNSGWPGLDEQVPCFGPRERAFLESIERLGWSDAFRRLRGRARAFTWYSPNGDNGFRLDQAFANPALIPRLRHVSHRWAGGRRSGVSDHAALLVDLA